MKKLGYLSFLVVVCMALGCGSGGEQNEPIKKGDYTMKPPQNRPHAGTSPSAPK